MADKTLTLLLCFILTACSTAVPPVPTETTAPTSAATSIPTETPLPTSTSIPSSTETATPSPVPVVENLSATVNANLLSCRYGPGADYLYFDGFLQGLKVKLVGWTGNSNWVWVKGDPKNCWDNAKFLNIEGDFKTLPIVYPDPARLPITPHYPPTTVLSATRDGNTVTVTWLAVPISPGDYEKENMFNYIVEVWRCEGGQLIFDPLPAIWSTISFVDETGCAQPSHGRVFVQEKHGYAGPAEIPWP